MAAPASTLISGNVDAKSATVVTGERRAALEAEIDATRRRMRIGKLVFGLMMVPVGIYLFSDANRGSPFLLSFGITSAPALQAISWAGLAILTSPIFYLEYCWRDAKKRLEAFEEND